MQKIEYTPERCEELLVCMDDPMYFIETYVIGAQLTPFQKEVVEGLMSGHVIARGPRRNGKSTVMWAFVLWYAMFHHERVIALVHSRNMKSEHVRQEFAAAFERLPYWMRPEIMRQNKDYIEFGNGTRLLYRTASANALRGMAISLLVLPDFPCIEPRLQEEIWASVVPMICATKGTCLLMHDNSSGDGEVFSRIWASAADKQTTFRAVADDRWEPK